MIQKLHDPIDIIGDVHGHLEPLKQLVALLGYDERGRHAGGRRLLFVGDLGDRGPDSPGVFEFVMTAAERGGAVSILGNHELPLIDADPREQLKPGNAWFFGEEDAGRKDEDTFGPFKRATEAQCERIRAFCDCMPIAVEHPDVRVVHACWDQDSLDFIQSKPGASNRDLIAASYARAAEHLAEAGLAERFQAAKEALRDRRLRKEWRPNLGVTAEEQVWIGDLKAGESVEQNRNPIKVLTSGVETPADVPAYLAAKWRFMRRVAWWAEKPTERPTVFGHYWRPREPIPHGQGDERPDLFGSARAEQWLGPGRLAMCVDYRPPSVWRERESALAAYRADLQELVYFDGKRVKSAPG